MWAQEAFAGGTHQPLSWDGWEGAAELATLLLLIPTLTPMPRPGLYSQVRPRLGPWIWGVREGGGGSDGCAGINAGGPHPVLPSWPGPVGVSATQLSCVPEHFQGQVLPACPRLASSGGSYDG